MSRLRVQKLHPDAKLPVRAHPQDVGLDLFCLHEFVLWNQRIYPANTGIAVQIPDSFAGYVQPRSGLATEGVTVVNSPGLIDPGYIGELKVILNLTGNNLSRSFKKGDKIAQLVIVPAPKFEAVEVDTLEESERGDSGFGSTDIRQDYSDIWC